MSDPDLFGVRKKARAKKPPVPNGAVQRLIGVYVAGYKLRFNEPPVITKADGALLKSLITTYGDQKVEQRLRAYINWDDPFVLKSGYSLRIFHVKWNELAARLKPVRTSESHGVIPDADETKKMLDRQRMKR